FPFVETTNWRLVRDYIDDRRAASSSLRFGLIEGETGSQQTYCTSHYATLNNHLETVRIDAPARATRARLVQQLPELYLASASKGSPSSASSVDPPSSPLRPAPPRAPAASSSTTSRGSSGPTSRPTNSRSSTISTSSRTTPASCRSSRWCRPSARSSPHGIR